MQTEQQYVKQHRELQKKNLLSRAREMGYTLNKIQHLKTPPEATRETEAK